LANSKTQNAFLFTVHAIFCHDYPLAVEPASTPRPLVQKKTLRDSLPIDMLLSSLSFLVVAQSSSKVPEGLMNNPVYSKCVFQERLLLINGTRNLVSLATLICLSSYLICTSEVHLLVLVNSRK